MDEGRTALDRDKPINTSGWVKSQAGTRLVRRELHRSLRFSASFEARPAGGS